MTFEVERSESGTVVKLMGGHRFEIGAIAEADLTSEPIRLFYSAGQIVDQAIEQLKKLGADPTLSTLGIEQKAEPVKADVVSRVAAAAGQVRLFENGITNMELQLYAVPEIDPGNSVAAIEDREVRDWWRSMSLQDRQKMLGQVQSESAQHERLMIALMRAPTPLALLDHETKFVRNAWKEAKRANDPITAARIDADRKLVETTRRGLVTLASITSTTMGWKAEKTLRTLVTSPYETVKYGYDIFGFNPAQVASMHQRIATEPKS